MILRIEPCGASVAFPLRKVLLPLNARRVIMIFGPAELSFNHIIIQHFHDVTVFVCFGTGQRIYIINSM